MFDACGGFKFSTYFLARSPIVLVYHRFSIDQNDLKINIMEFKRQMVELKKIKTIVPLTKIVEAIRSGEALPKQTVAITVDDGYEDFYHLAFPILRELRLPATLFVPTSFVGEGAWLWPDRIKFALESTKLGRAVFFLDGEYSWDLRTYEGRIKAWHDIADFCLTLCSKDRDCLLSDIEHELSVSIPHQPVKEYRAVSRDQLHDMVANGIAIGSHSHSHPRLRIESKERQRYEIVFSKEYLEDMLQTRVDHFCYPHGGADDFDETAEELVREAGYRGAVTAYLEGGNDPYRIGRQASGNTHLEFRKVISGMNVALSKLGQSYGISG